MNFAVTPQDFIETLIDRGLISSDQLRIAEIDSEKSKNSIENSLRDLGFVTPALLRELKGELSGQASVDLKHALPDADALALAPADFCRKHSILPVSLKGKTLTVAFADANNLQVMDKLAHLLGTSLSVHPVIGSERDINEAIDRFYGFELSIDGILLEIEAGNLPSEVATDGGVDSEYSHPFVRLVDAILADAVRRSASDIHFEPEAGFLRVRYRIDGVMRQIRSLHYDHWSAISVRLKVLSELNIAEKRAPQDGRLSFAVGGAPVEFRVSVLPTIHGENIVLRILDRQKGIVAIESLGLADSALASLNLMMARPEGLILVTGPTGSGKTTTLYSMLNQISDERINIMTMEDPVEYPLPLLRQTTVNEQVKLDFAEGVKTILRQDPDVILIGEIRDKQTAEMAIRASMTGHQVYSTLHANSAIGALARLADVGVSTASVVGNVIGIVAQRLVRKLCDQCKQSVVADDVENKITGGLQHIHKPVGCEACDQQGYQGRIAIMEVLRFNAEFETRLTQGSSAAELHEVAAQHGFETLMDDALSKVASGQTSLEEVSRVIDFTNKLV